MLVGQAEAVGRVLSLELSGYAAELAASLYITLTEDCSCSEQLRSPRHWCDDVTSSQARLM